jgi:hypothetical protein
VRRIVPAIGLIVSALVASLPAQELASPSPATRPSRTDRPWRERIGTYNPNAANEPVTPEDQSEIEKFMSAYSPKRWEKFKNINENRKDKLWRLMRNQMRALEHLKSEDPRIYELRLARLTIEDNMFALGWQIKHEPENKDPAKLRADLHGYVSQFVDNNFQEQKLRVTRMQERLKKEQQDLVTAQAKLKDFEDRKESLIAKGAEDIENDRLGELRDLGGPLLGPHKPHDGATPSTEPTADGSDSHTADAAQ